ncbi:hypothetical protein PGB28_08640 [Primorskyibacter aestuariivivens]|uniref:hypothetical protein n=1 Tax=Primorskyibacter aestuariivivens TaxID=1888912 RepID=UPI00230031FC|nr:hypothetical protein [Primorskyibacter aestuariivivens]MDA7428526.1 hypothetical protein [Primorskyibacter aestuariivivens]
MRTRGATIWLRHALAFGLGLAVLYGAGEAGQYLFAGLKVAPLVWHLAIAALATALAALTYALVMRRLTGRAAMPLWLGGVLLIMVGFTVMAGLIYSGLTTAVEAFVACLLAIFGLGGALVTRRHK